MSSTKYIFFSVSSSGRPSAAPAGLTCLNDAAAGRPVACLQLFYKLPRVQRVQEVDIAGFAVQNGDGQLARPA